jgi:molybdopterin-containing oxidoreductase family iron-sulfur binding subunit
LKVKAVKPSTEGETTGNQPCHAENNIAVVGEDESIERRSLHWIRIERYWEGEYPNLRARFMPVLCQHCGEAPCEPVCPVFATYHNPEGLNAQIYNRCIGTRFCGSACPYKVRVYNWFRPEFPYPLSEQLDAAANNTELSDGDIQPACVQTCPPSALVFGDLNDPESRVSRLARSQRAFRLLEVLGTDPAVIYLKGGESNA